jgi:hypothetical protein
MKAKIHFFLFLGAGLALTAQCAFAGAEYQGKLEAGLSRGVRNIIGAPLEIPVTIHKYHEGDGRPVIRETAGLVDGTFRMVSREVSGLMDTLLVLLPGEQDGIPLNPETLF